MKLSVELVSLCDNIIIIFTLEKKAAKQFIHEKWSIKSSLSSSYEILKAGQIFSKLFGQSSSKKLLSQSKSKSQVKGSPK